MSAETWIVFKVEDLSAHGWQERKLMPSEALTSILAEEWDSSGKLPQVGDRLRNYANLADPGNGITHGKAADWIVTKVQHFASRDSETQIVICLCDYQPISAEWEPLKRGQPVTEMLGPVVR